MSKAEEMKIEIKARKQATDKMTAIVFAEIQKHLKKCHNKMSITLQTGPNGRHRYFTIKRYKDKIMMGEMVYGDIEIPLIRYKNVSDIDSAIAEMKYYLSLFFKTFFEDSMHELLSFLSSCNTETEWKACLDSYKEYIKSAK